MSLIAAVESLLFTAEAPLTLAPGEPLKLRVFIDGPMIEVFANSRQCITQVVFPSLAASRQVKLRVTVLPAQLLGGRAFDLAKPKLEDMR